MSTTSHTLIIFTDGEYPRVVAASLYLNKEIQNMGAEDEFLTRCVKGFSYPKTKGFWKYTFQVEESKDDWVCTQTTMNPLTVGELMDLTEGRLP